MVKLLILKNKNEILKKAKLIKPLETKYLEYRQEKRFSAEATEDNITVAGRASAAMIIFCTISNLSHYLFMQFSLYLENKNEP